MNCLTHSQFYRNNVNGEGNQGTNCPSLGLDTQLDGLTVVLTANAALKPGTNHFEFFITDKGDSALDSAVFIEGGSFSADDPNPAPEPASLALLGIGLAGLGAMRRRKTA